MSRTKIALAGIGKIARDQHVPALAASDAFDLAGAVTGHAPPDGVPGFATVSEMKKALPDVTALSICTPPRGRYALIREALENGLDVMVEKPPAASPSEARAYVELAKSSGRVLFVTWHSRAAAAVEPARAWLADKRITSVRVDWKEDVRVWHPGQSWIWEPGIGVFDPGVNALSVITRILPGPLTVETARLRFPENKAAPIAADIALTNLQGLAVAAAFDFDQRGPQTWDIRIETDAGALTLSKGASQLFLDDAPLKTGDEPEYHALYRRFDELLSRGESDTDLSPFELVADCFTLGRREIAAPFDDF